MISENVTLPVATTDVLRAIAPIAPKPKLSYFEVLIKTSNALYNRAVLL